MGKFISIIVLLVLIGITAFFWNKPANDTFDDLPEKQQKALMEEYGSVEEFPDNVFSRENDRFFNRLGLGLITTIFGGILAAIYILPILAHKATHVAYDSGEKVGPDPLNAARAALAQGNYEVAIEKFEEGAKADPTNRMPHIEIARIQEEHLGDIDRAIQSLRHGLESQEWRENDAAFFMFRIAELLQVKKQDTSSAAEILRQIIEAFPETRHSANATHKLREMGMA